jgi:hypothetical protein
MSRSDCKRQNQYQLYNHDTVEVSILLLALLTCTVRAVCSANWRSFNRHYAAVPAVHTKLICKEVSHVILSNTILLYVCLFLSFAFVTACCARCDFQTPKLAICVSYCNSAVAISICL